MQYIKHYYVNDVTGDFMTTTNDAPAKRHPVKEIPGIGVKVWSHDPDGIDVCISEVTSKITLSNIEVDDKFAVKILTEDQYNSVINLQKEVATLAEELYPHYGGGVSPDAEYSEPTSDQISLLETKHKELKDLINSF